MANVLSKMNSLENKDNNKDVVVKEDGTIIKRSLNDSQ